MDLIKNRVFLYVSLFLAIVALSIFAIRLKNNSQKPAEIVKTPKTLYNEIEKSQQETNYNKVVNLSQEFLQKYSDDEYAVNVMNNLARAYNKMKQYPEALKVFKSIQSNYPESEFAKYAEPIISDINQKMSAPLDSFLAKNSLVNLYKQGYKYSSNKNYKKAIETFKKFLELYPNSSLASNAQYWIGESYYGLEDYENSLTAFNTVIEKYNNSEKFAASVTKIDMIKEITKANEKDKKQKLLEETFYKKILKIYYNKQYDETITGMNDFIKKNPKSQFIPNAHYWIGESYYAKSGWAYGNYDDSEKLFSSAKKSFNRVIKKYPKSNKITDSKTKLAKIEQIRAYIKSRKLFLNKKYPKARKSFYSFLKKYPKSFLLPNCYYWIAQTYQRENNFEAASENYQIIISKYPNSNKIADATNRLAELNKQEKKEVSQKSFQLQQEDSLKAINQNDELLSKTDSIYVKVKEFFNNKKYATVITFIQEQKNRNLDITDSVKLLLAESYFEIKNYKLAMEQFLDLKDKEDLPLSKENINEKIIKCDKIITEQKINRSIFLKNFEEAVERIDSFSIKYPDDLDINKRLLDKKISLLYLDIKDFEKAINASNKYLDKYQDTKNSDKIKAFKILSYYELFNATNQTDYENSYKKELKEFESTSPESKFIDIIYSEVKRISNK